MKIYKYKTPIIKMHNSQESVDLAI